MIQKMPYLETLNLDGNKSIFQNNVIDLNYLLMGGVLTKSTIKTLSLNQFKLKNECLQVIIKFLSKNQHKKYHRKELINAIVTCLRDTTKLKKLTMHRVCLKNDKHVGHINSLLHALSQNTSLVELEIDIFPLIFNLYSETRKPSTEGTDSSSDSEIDDELTRKYFLQFIHKHNKLKKATFLSGYTRNETVFLTQCLHTNKYINHLTLHPDSMTGTGFQYFEMLLSTLTNLKSFEISYPWNNEEFVPIMYAIINYSRYLKTLSISCDESEGKGSVDSICKLISLKSKKIKNLTISDINDLQLRKFNKLCTALLKNTKLEHVNMPVTTELNTKGWNKILNILDNNIHLNQFTMVYEDLEDFNRSPFEFKAQLLLNHNKRLQNTIIKDFYYYWQRRILKNNHEKIIKIANFPVDIKILKLRFPNNNINSIIQARKLLLNHSNDNSRMFLLQNIHDFIRWLYTGLTTNRPVIFFLFKPDERKIKSVFPRDRFIKIYPDTNRNNTFQ
ncbi:leucine rich repeat family protein [Anaeramoeba flamelloides]|uniref:Leucine rich repeat family protein n=1 Tax=Anaeramoeba flamelloides TaxID=1746091 RepID=A0AAV7YAS2_9EUKA|nr:leucine rich repeat family protein [Anaeramoeba flamelloides]